MEKLPSIDEILKEINRLDSQKIDGFTTKDFMAHTGMAEKWCIAKIRELINRGYLEYAGKVPVLSIDNRMCKSPAYRLVNKKKD